MSSVSVMSWHLLPENQERYAQEVRQLRSASRSRKLEVQDLADGSTVFVVDTLEPPGYRIYLKTPPRYPFLPPTLLVEKDGKSINVQPAGLLNWQPGTTMAELVDQVVRRGVQRRLTLILGLSGGLVAAVSVVIVTLLLLSIKQLDGVAKDQTAIAGQNTALAQRRATVTAGLSANLNDPALLTALAGIDAEQAANANRANQLLTAQALQAEYTGQALTQGALVGKANAEQSGTATANANALNTAAAQATASYMTANAPTATPVPTPTPVPGIPTAVPVVRTTVRQDVPTPVPATTEAAPTVFFVPTPVFVPTPSVAPFVPTARPQPTDTPVPVRRATATPPPPPTAKPVIQTPINGGGSSGNEAPKTTQPPAKTTQPPAQTTQPPAKTTVAPPPPSTIASPTKPTPLPTARVG